MAVRTTKKISTRKTITTTNDKTPKKEAPSEGEVKDFKALKPAVVSEAAKSKTVQVFEAPKTEVQTSVSPPLSSTPSLVVDDRIIPDSGLPTEIVSGVVDIATEGSGLLRPKFHPTDNDIYISASQIRRFNLRVGDMVEGLARRPKENERYWGLLKVEKVNGNPAEELPERNFFDDLVAVYPNEQIILATEEDVLTTRVIDLIAPIGFGQRGLIVSPPKAGKTWLIKDIIAGIAKNYIDSKSKRGTKVHLMAVLIGERPEEVTDIERHMREATGGVGEVAASNFDEPADAQTAVGELALERAKRLVESGKDVIILLDSITRMARAYNLALPTSGRTLTGGFDPAALFPAKKFFGAARKIEENGSLTIIGTCLVETGSRMDDLIYEEFKGTGNMELHLTRRLAEKRIFPAIDVTRSGTRQEELLYGKEKLQKVYTLRRMLDMVSEDERTETLLERLRKTKSNDEFLESLKTA